MQYIYYFNNRFIANVTPTCMAAGRAGGIVIVIKSSSFTIISSVEREFKNCGKSTKNPIKVINPRSPIYFKDWIKNWNWLGLGYIIPRIIWPLSVLNPVLMIKAAAVGALSNYSFEALLTWRIVVP